jgi:gamma-glutamylputrescine oxidase
VPESGIPAWEDGSWTPLPALKQNIAADVCVIGLGGSGLTCVNALLSLGHTVIGIDAGLIGGGAAGRNGGFLLAGTSEFYHDSVESLGRDRARRLYQLTLDEINRIASDTPEVVRRTGSLRIAGSAEEEGDISRQLNALRTDGFRAEPYHGPEGRGLLVPDDAAFQPLGRCRLLARKAIAGGARLYEKTAAVHLEPCRVHTAEGHLISCERVVAAIDGRLEALLPELSSRVRTARLQMLATAPAPEVSIPRPVYSRYGYDYWQQLPDTRVVVGGCRDQEMDAEWTTERSISQTMQARLEKLLRGTIGVSQPVTHRWAAHVSFSDGELPVFEEVRKGVIAIGAYSGTGNVIGALYGRMAADIAATGHSEMAASIGLSAARPSTPSRTPGRNTRVA